MKNFNTKKLTQKMALLLASLSVLSACGNAKPIKKAEDNKDNTPKNHKEVSKVDNSNVTNEKKEESKKEEVKQEEAKKEETKIVNKTENRTIKANPKATPKKLKAIPKKAKKVIKSATKTTINPTVNHSNNTVNKVENNNNIEQAKQEEARKLAEEKAKQEEAKRLAEEKAKEEEEAKKLAEEKAKQEEQKRLAEEKAKEEEQKRLAEEQAKQEEAKRKEEEKAKEEEQKKKEEEQKKKEDNTAGGHNGGLTPAEPKKPSDEEQPKYDVNKVYSENVEYDGYVVAGTIAVETDELEVGQRRTIEGQAGHYVDVYRETYRYELYKSPYSDYTTYVKRVISSDYVTKKWINEVKENVVLIGTKKVAGVNYTTPNALNELIEKSYSEVSATYPKYENITSLYGNDEYNKLSREFENTMSEARHFTWETHTVKEDDANNFIAKINTAKTNYLNFVNNYALIYQNLDNYANLYNSINRNKHLGLQNNKEIGERVKAFETLLSNVNDKLRDTANLTEVERNALVETLREESERLQNTYDNLINSLKAKDQEITIKEYIVDVQGGKYTTVLKGHFVEDTSKQLELINKSRGVGNELQLDETLNKIAKLKAIQATNHLGDVEVVGNEDNTLLKTVDFDFSYVTFGSMPTDEEIFEHINKFWNNVGNLENKKVGIAIFRTRIEGENMPTAYYTHIAYVYSK